MTENTVKKQEPVYTRADLVRAAAAGISGGEGECRRGGEGVDAFAERVVADILDEVQS